MSAVTAVYQQCGKCKKISGDDWSQCKGSCPMIGSPHFNADAITEYGPPTLVTMAEYKTQLAARETGPCGICGNPGKRDHWIGWRCDSDGCIPF